MRHALLASLVLILLAGFDRAPAADVASGWRGNGTGLWPDTTAPLNWSRIAKGAMEGLRGQAQRPKDEQPGDAPLVHKGLPAQWLILGPLGTDDAVKELDRETIAGESQMAPAEGDTAANLRWTRLDAKQDDRWEFGTSVLPWVDLVKPENFERNRIFYAHTYLFSPRGGPAVVILQHCFGVKAWLNGEPVFRSADRAAVLGSYEAISRFELAHDESADGRFKAALKPGWNRLLLKVMTSNRDDYKIAGFCLRLMDPPDVEYASENIGWMTELPGRSTSTPIIVGDRIFLTAEPDTLVCIDKKTGKLLWSAAVNYYEALTQQERSTLPALAERVDPLVEKLRKETSRAQRSSLRAKIQQALVEIDPARFTLNTDGHFAAHLGIVGFTMPTPVSDGAHVYTWCGLGVAACFDLDGHRQWITRVPTGPLIYGSSPALANGVLAVYMDKLQGLDAKTGAVRWTQNRIHKNIAAIQAATFDNQSVFVTQAGEVVRPTDGKLLFRPRTAVSGDGGCWGPPVILGSRMYVGQYGVHHASILDFHDMATSDWKPDITEFDLDLPRELSLRPDGSWLDRSTAGSPLVHQGLMYLVDIYGWLYVVDLETKRTVYFKDLHQFGLDGLMHYNAVPVAASPTLVRDKVLVMDNQGHTLVLAPGREFKVLGVNRIETELERPWPIPGQETLSYAPPIADANCLYLRGERYLYCITAKSR